MGSVCIFQLGEIPIGDLRVHKQIMLTDSQKKLSKQNLQPLKHSFLGVFLQKNYKELTIKHVLGP